MIHHGARHGVVLALLAMAACSPQGADRQAAPEAAPATTQAGNRSVGADTVTDGPVKAYDAQGRLELEGQMVNGQRQGIWTTYFPNGRVRSRSEYRDGVLQGITTAFRANGAMYYTGQHRNGRETGTWRFYDDQGNLARTVEYDSLGTIINDTGNAPAGR